MWQRVYWSDGQRHELVNLRIVCVIADWRHPSVQHSYEIGKVRGQASILRLFSQYTRQKKKRPTIFVRNYNKFKQNSKM